MSLPFPRECGIRFAAPLERGRFSMSSVHWSPILRTESAGGVTCCERRPLGDLHLRPALLATAHPGADFGQPPIITPISAKLDRGWESNRRIPLPAPQGHVAGRDQR